MTEDIKLTLAELNVIKDDAGFKATVTLSLKNLTQIVEDLKINLDKHVELAREYEKITGNLKAQQAVQWFILSGIVVSILWFKFN